MDDGAGFTDPRMEKAREIAGTAGEIEHFRAGIPRTYAYELIDEKPDAALTDPEQHFGLLRNDFSEKPAFTA